MGKLHRAVVILLAVFAMPAWPAQPPAGLAAAFGAAPRRTYLTLSPGGRMLAWLRSDRSGDEVVIYDLDAHAVRRMLRIPGLTVDWLGWESDSTLLIDTLDTERLPTAVDLDWGRAVRSSRLLALDIVSGRSHVLLADRLVGEESGYFDTGADLLAWDIPRRPHTVIMAATVFDRGQYRERTGTMIHSARGDSGMVSALFSVDSHTGKDKAVAYGDAFTSQWVVDADGNPVARTEWHSNRYTIDARQGGGWRQIYRSTLRIEPDILGLDADAHALLAMMRDRDGRRYLSAIPLDGSAPKLVLPALTRQVLSVEFSRYGDRLTAVWVGRSSPHRIWIEPAAEQRYESVARAFPGREVRVYDPSRDGKEVMAEVQDSAAPPIYYLVNFSTHHADIAGEAYPQLAHVALGTAHTVRYRARDGRTVHAQVILPPGGGKDLPLVVVPPGGPEGNDPGEFDWFAQYLAARGYAVLRPDIALTALPSEGGPIFWGGASQRYTVDGVRLLVKERVADPRRVCIVGVGYGGYAALAGAAFYPGAYACAVSVNGISDLSSLLGHEIDVFGEAHSDHSALATWRADVGSRFDPKVIAESPVHAAGAVAAPVLLIYGENDTVVPAEQSLEMEHALEMAGKHVAIMKLDGPDHRLRYRRSRVEVLKAVGEFLQDSLH